MYAILIHGIIGIIALFLTACPCRGFDGEHLSLATLNWAPYVGEDLEEYGFTTEIVTRVFAHAGYRTSIAFMPWVRVLRHVARGDYDAMYPAYFSEERSRAYALTEPFAQSPLVLFKRKQNSIAYTCLRDLEGYRIGVVRGYVNSPAFDAAAYLEKEPTNSDESNLRKLYRGRIDLAVVDLYTAQYLLEDCIPEAREALEPMDPPLQIKPLYVGISREVDGYASIVAAFNRSLRFLSENGALEAIRKRHGLSAP